MCEDSLCSRLSPLHIGRDFNPPHSALDNRQTLCWASARQERLLVGAQCGPVVRSACFRWVPVVSGCWEMGMRFAARLNRISCPGQEAVASAVVWLHCGRKGMFDVAGGKRTHVWCKAAYRGWARRRTAQALTPGYAIDKGTFCIKWEYDVIIPESRNFFRCNT